MNPQNKCLHSEHPAYFGSFGWICNGCGKEVPCSIRYTAEDMKPHQYENGIWGAPDPCCPLAPHPKEKDEQKETMNPQKTYCEKGIECNCPKPHVSGECFKHKELLLDGICSKCNMSQNRVEKNYEVGETVRVKYAGEERTLNIIGKLSIGDSVGYYGIDDKCREGLNLYPIYFHEEDIINKTP